MVWPPKGGTQEGDVNGGMEFILPVRSAFSVQGVNCGVSFILPSTCNKIHDTTVFVLYYRGNLFLTVNLVFFSGDKF